MHRALPRLITLDLSLVEKYPLLAIFDMFMDTNTEFMEEVAMIVKRKMVEFENFCRCLDIRGVMRVSITARRLTWSPSSSPCWIRGGTSPGMTSRTYLIDFLWWRIS